MRSSTQKGRPRAFVVCLYCHQWHRLASRPAPRSYRQFSHCSRQTIMLLLLYHSQECNFTQPCIIRLRSDTPIFSDNGIFKAHRRKIRRNDTASFTQRQDRQCCRLWYHTMLSLRRERVSRVWHSNKGMEESRLADFEKEIGSFARLCALSGQGDHRCACRWDSSRVFQAGFGREEGG